METENKLIAVFLSQSRECAKSSRRISILCLELDWESIIWLSADNKAYPGVLDQENELVDGSYGLYCLKVKE